MTVEPTPLRIALLTYSTKPRGGVVHTLALAEALAGLGQDVTVFSLGRGGDTGFFRDVAPAVRVRVVPLAEIEGEDLGPRILRSIATLGAGLEPERGAFDVVHAQDCISANAAGRPIRTVHHLDEFTTPQLVACHERAIRAPVAHVCVSDPVAAELREGWGITATVIPNGVDAARFAAAAGPDAAGARAAWTDRLGRYVLAVGGIEPRKGSMELLEAFALLRGAHPGVRLVIGGGETVFDYRDYRVAWQARADELGVEPVVLGPVPDPDLPSLVAAAEVFAFPSVKEGFGLAAMEALAAGVPLVASDLPVLRRTFDGSAAFAGSVPELSAALSGVLHDGPDPGRRAAGRTLAARHTWDAAARAHLELYRRLPAAERVVIRS
ncbi:glycosyltransferase-like protein [Pseudonocardia sediminis]|uniref:Glycosyltransferase-like protein n=1 Tax=Pseudonocardia sediminis TaxID=1397368 RepID=A0A4Q7V6A4_PSEST|nr:MSMEG_0565 family glycosyltransferase [Pseudonocardia sediminis]RZT89141.1 glycosyltransferase-like protein [Pseudonocardia sediminis]